MSAADGELDDLELMKRGLQLGEGFQLYVGATRSAGAREGVIRDLSGTAGLHVTVELTDRDDEEAIRAEARSRRIAIEEAGKCTSSSEDQAQTPHRSVPVTERTTPVHERTTPARDPSGSPSPPNTSYRTR